MKIAEKILNHIEEEKVDSLKLWSKIYPMFTKPIIHLKKFAKHEIKDFDKKDQKLIQSKVEEISTALSELDKLIEDSAFKE